MKKNMKYHMIILATCLMIIGCKQDNWLDWKTVNEAWLTHNMTKDSIQVTPSGLQYKVIRKGFSNAGPKPDDIKSVEVKYTGTLINGHVFDSSGDKTTTFAVNGVQKGFAEGLKLMHQSGHYIFYIPANLMYGEDGIGTEGNTSYIPPYSTLIFDVTLVRIF